MRRSWLFIALLGACGGDDDGGSADDPDATASAADAGCEAPDRPAAIVYLNKDGAVFTPGPESSVDNTTGVVTEERTFDPHPHATWPALADCFRAGLAAF